MTLLLGYLAHSIYKIQGLREIRKCEISGEVVLVDHLPHWHFLPQISEFLALERRHAAPARNAGFTGQLGHKFSSPAERDWEDRKSTRLNSSHSSISYAVFCLKKKKTTAGLL